jgi:hypothetical protein
VSILVPSLIYAGDTVAFDVPAFKDAIGTNIDSATYTLTWYARTNINSEGGNCCWDSRKYRLARHSIIFNYCWV